MSGHTPLPWCFVAGDIVSGTNERRGKIANVSIAHKGSAERDANAAFIVRACNSHYELLEALELLVKRCGPFAPDGIFARAAIAKAKGEDA